MSDSTSTLSEQLFSARRTQKETSQWMQLALSPRTSSSLWYRYDWQALAKRQQIPLLEQYRVVRALAKRIEPEQRLDTVVGYHTGNWIYEWSNLASEYQQAARAFVSIEQYGLAAQAFMAASARYSMAAYPNLHPDSLALQAQVQSDQCFLQGLKYQNVICKTLDVPFAGRTVPAKLYLPTQSHSVPTVVLIGDFQTTSYQAWQWFERYFAPLGYGMITLDLPSFGGSRRYFLKEDTSALHQALLVHLKTVPWVDHHKVALWGCGFGANLAVRLGCLLPAPLKAVISLEGTMHASFVPEYTHAHFEQQDWDRVASLFGKFSASQSHLASLWSACSLKKQGILAKKRSDLPMLALACENSLGSVLTDNRWIAQSSREGECQLGQGNTLQAQRENAISLGISWLQQQMDK